MVGGGTRVVESGGDTAVVIGLVGLVVLVVAGELVVGARIKTIGSTLGAFSVKAPTVTRTSASPSTVEATKVAAMPTNRRSEVRDMSERIVPAAVMTEMRTR